MHVRVGVDVHRTVTGEDNPGSSAAVNLTQVLFQPLPLLCACMIRREQRYIRISRS
jgi:hypothetical protein